MQQAWRGADDAATRPVLTPRASGYPAMEAPAARKSVVTSQCLPHRLVLLPHPKPGRESVHRSGPESERGRIPQHVEAMK